MDFDTEAQKPYSRAEIFGLATLAGHAGTRREIRIKAMRALARIPDQNAIHVLGEMALWEEDEEMRREAYRALETTFGDDLPEVLEGIRLELTGQLAADKEDEDDLPQTLSPELIDREVYRLEGQPQAYQQNPTTREEGAPLWLLWVVLGLVVIGGLVIMTMLR